MTIISRLAKLEAAAGATAGRSFTFSGGGHDADLDAFARSFGVELNDRDQVMHLSISGQGAALDQCVGDLILAHCNDMAVTLAYVAKYGKSLVPADGDAA